MQFYYIHTDYQGSVIAITDADGDFVFQATYDAWGRQTVTKNEIAFFRGYTGHEMLNDYGLINMNGRLYDPCIGRFLSPDNYVQQPTNSQNFNRYSYCLNNPLKYTDPSGEWFLGSLLSFHTDMIINVFTHGFAFKRYDFKRTKNAWKIDMGMFKGSFSLILNKWTWNIVNSSWGNSIAHSLNLIGLVDNVSDMDGMVAVGGLFKGEKAFTLGHYSFGPNNYTATWKDHLFVHEYGHYMQSQIIGSSYLLTIGVPSLLSAMKKDGRDHRSRWFEVDASRRGAKHFDKKYGSGAAGYIPNNSNYFDIYSFYTNKTSPYSNARGTQNGSSFPISNSKNNIWDYIIPIYTYQLIPSFVIKYIW